jgi:predicted ATP-grasp superfamily ATP-dependent carboligase
MTARVLVTDGGERSALAAVRGLGRAHYSPYVVSARPPSLAGSSRYCREEFSAPDPLADPAGFSKAVGDVAQKHAVDVVLPITDAAHLAVLSGAPLSPSLRVAAPDRETFLAVADKELVLERAEKLGIAVPRQEVLQEPGSLREALDAGLDFPLVVKPSRSVSSGSRVLVKLGVRHVADVAECEAVLEALPHAAYPVLLQQRVVGPGVGIFLLLWNGERRAIFSHRRIREKPPSGGVSVYRESIPADPELVARSASLLESFGWQGAAMVEYKVDEETDTPFLMEVNGRLWGSLQLAIDAGVNFPVLLVQSALGQEPEPLASYRIGIRSRWWWGDVDHLLLRLRRSAEELALPPGTPGRWKTLGDFLVPWRPGDRSEILRLTDPVPFLHETRRWLRRR